MNNLSNTIARNNLIEIVNQCRKEFELQSIERSYIGFLYLTDEYLNYWLDKHLIYFNLLNPKENSSIFDIGPGCTFFLYYCQNIRNCKVAGTDLPDNAVYNICRNKMNIKIQPDPVFPNTKINFKEKYDYITSFGMTYNFVLENNKVKRYWNIQEYLYLLQDFYDNLNPDGKILLGFNIEALTPDVLNFFSTNTKIIDKHLVLLTKEELKNILSNGRI